MVYTLHKLVNVMFSFFEQRQSSLRLFGQTCLGQKCRLREDATISDKALHYLPFM